MPGLLDHSIWSYAGRGYSRFLALAAIVDQQRCWMKDNGKQKRIRLEGEKRRDAEQESEVAQRLRKWKRATICLAVALAASIGSIVPFLEGHILHEHFAGGAKYLIYLSMCLPSLFMYAAGTTYNFWSYLRALRKINGNATADQLARPR